jgi:hypothetical protein
MLLRGHDNDAKMMAHLNMGKKNSVLWFRAGSDLPLIT